jgi:tetratricopeptide (TPR) repeat protein
MLFCREQTGLNNTRHNITKNEMTTSEQSYITRITSQARKHKESSLSQINKEEAVELLALLEEAVLSYPQSPKLWCLRGDLIQLFDENQYEFADILHSYQQAVTVDPSFCEAYESIGYYYDVLEADLPVAEVAFRKAIELGMGLHSYFGLARVLAEQGKREEALSILAPDYCPFHMEFEIDILREEIEAGEILSRNK